MNGNHPGSPEDIFDLALQDILDGLQLDKVIARYPQLGGEAETLLRAAQSIRRGPHPELSAGKIAYMVVHAQAQAAKSRRAIPTNGVHQETPSLLPSLLPSPKQESAPTELPGKVQTGSGPTWIERLRGRLLPAAPALRATAAFALVLALLAGVLAFARSPNRPSVILPVPQFTVALFTLDASIDDITLGKWTIGGQTVEVDGSTTIIGAPRVGAVAHVEGQLVGANRKLATRISILTAEGVTTSTPARVAATPSGPVVSGGPQPTEAGAGLSVSPTAQPTAPATAAGSSNLPTGPKGTSTVPTKSTPTNTPTRATPATRSGAAAQQTRTPLATPTQQPSTTREVTATPSQPGSTSTQTSTPEPVATHTPHPSFTPSSTTDPSSTPSATATWTPILTATSLPTSTEEPTIEPENTPAVSDTDTPELEETATHEQHPTGTPTPTSISSATPVTTRTPVPSRTRVPTGTPTSETTVEPEETPTGVPTRESTTTPRSTETHEPQETRSSEATHETKGTGDPHVAPTP